jgi:serine/threonine protein kinase
LSDQSWKELQDLFHLLLKKEESEREAALESLSRENPDLQRRVAALLTSFKEAGQFLETPAIELSAGQLTPDEQPAKPSPVFPSIDQVIGHYRIVEKLGEGGMGQVFLAEDTELERHVALKFLPEALQEDPNAHKRFMREAKSAAALDHPFICNIHEVRRTDDEKDFIVMEFVEGQTLKDRLEDGPLPLPEVLKIGTEIAEALETAHEAGIIHRDLKPANIMLTHVGHAKVMDFGLAKRLSDDSGDEDITSALTGKGTTLGTLAYMSPEQLGGEEADHRSDIFSFGIVLYELLTGVHPFRRARQVDTFNAILSSVPEPFSEYEAETPELLDQAVQKMLQKVPENRYQSLSEIRDILPGLASTLTQPHHSETRGTYIGPFLGLASVLGVLALVAGWWFLSPALTDRSPSPLSSVPLTSYVGQEREPSLSPDGNRVAFSWDGPNQDNFDIYVKGIGPGEPLRLTEDPARDYSPSWSPDSRYIAFLRARPDGMASLILVPPLGGQEQERIVVHAPYLPADWGYAHFIAWSPDSQWLAICDKDSTQGPWSIFLTSMQTGQKLRLTSAPANSFGDRGPLFSPDGKNLVFSRISDVIVGGDLYAITMPSSGNELPKPERLTNMNRTVESLAWKYDSPEIIFFTQGNPSTWKVNARGGPTQPQPIHGIEGSHIATAMNSDRVVYSESSNDSNIWLLRVSDRKRRSGESERYIASTSDDMSPDYSSDDKRRIAFISNRSGNSEVWICDDDGSNAMQLTSFAGPWVGGPRWSPDSKQIVFDSRVGGNSNIYLISSSGGVPIQLTNHPGQDGEPTWSRDGKEIYFNSDRSGSNQVWKIPAAGGETVQVTRGGGSYAQESADRKLLYFKKADLLWRRPLEDGKEQQVLKELLRSGPSYTISDSGIYFVPRPSSTQANCVKFYDFAAGEVRMSTSMAGRPGWGIASTPDGERILYTQVDHIHSDLKLIEKVP